MLQPDSLRSLFRPTNPTEFWTLIAGLGAAATGLFTFFIYRIAKSGLKALGLTKQDMVTRATRDARACAIDCSRALAEDIIPSNAVIMGEFVQKKVPVFVKDPSEVVFGGNDEKTKIAAARVWVAALPSDLQSKCIKLLNQIESWAMHFTNALADSEIAYGPCAPAYCSIVIQLYPLLLVIRTKDSAGQYPNLVHLFEAWYDTKAKGVERERMKRILKMLEESQSKGVRATLPGALGTDRAPLPGALGTDLE